MLALKLLLLLGLSYALMLGALLRYEDRLVFPAPHIDRAQLQAQALAVGALERTVVTQDGLPLYGWRRGQGDKLVLIFSGNGGSVGYVQAREQRFMALGFETLHVNYRGYPGSAGAASEAGLLLDAQAAWREALRTHPPERILVFGKSLGGGVAVGLLAALDQQPAGVVLESTFSSLARVAFRRFPIIPTALVMQNPFDSLARAPSLRLPALVLHGDQDELIPYSHGQRLAAALPQGRFVVAEGMDHNADLLQSAAPASALSTLLHDIGLDREASSQ